MKTRKKYSVRCVCIVVAMFVLYNTSCSLMTRAPLRVGVFPRPGCELIWVAKEKGFFKEEGLDVIVAQYSSWVSTLNAFNQGKVDMSVQTVMSLLVSGRKGVIVAVTDRFKGDVLVGKRTMKSIVDLTNLKGKPISAEVGTDGYYMLESVVQQLGLARKEIAILPQFTDDAIDSFIRGDTQAVFCYPPYVKKALRKGKGRVLYAQEFHPLSPATVIVAPEQLIAERPQDIGRFIRAWYKAVAFFKNHRDEAVRIMAKAEGVSPEDFAESLSDITVFDYEEARQFMQSDKMGELVTGVRDSLSKLGMPISKVARGELVDTRFMERRIPRK